MKRHTYGIPSEEDTQGYQKRFHRQSPPKSLKRRTHEDSFSYPPSPMPPPPIPSYSSSHFMLAKVRKEKDDAWKALKLQKQKEEEMKLREAALQDELRRRELQIAMQREIYFQEMARMQMGYERQVTKSGYPWVV